MNNQELINTFAKGKQADKKAKGKNAIIYTRVSSKEQTENMSLDVQLKGCEHFAGKNGLDIKGIFGGTYESAQTDERNEFQRMVKFAKNFNQGISFIIVYSLERFSRTGENAIWLSRQLRELGITILSVTQPIDTTNPSGVLQQNILFLFSQYDNDLRRQKCVDGMREKLSKGEWVGNAPKGYSYDRSSGTKEQKIVINENGKYIKRAFELKVYDKFSHMQICEEISRLGFKLTKQNLCDIFRNPFYAGYISHNLLGGQMAKGKHPALISEELFLQANDLLKKHNQGYKQNRVEENIPLKQFVACAECGTPFTGYIVKSKNLWYYKCNRIGCKCNKSAKLLHSKFGEVLGYYSIDPIYINPTVEFLHAAYEQKVERSFDETREVKSKITELSRKIETLEERYALGETEQEVYKRVKAKLTDERSNLQGSLKDLSQNLSNPLKAITESVQKLVNLSELWHSRNAQGKLSMQKMVFPEGLLYDRKIEHYRTTKVNEAIKVIDSFTSELDINKKDRSKKFIDLSDSVAGTGLEPVTFGL